MSIKPSVLLRGTALFALLAIPAVQAQELPDGKGRDETVKLCSQCHELARSISLRQDREGWATTISKMAAFGMKATPEDVNTVLEYLSHTYPAEEVPKVNVNTARAIDLEAGLSLRRSQAAALVAFRDKNGPFKSLADLKKVPSLDAKHLDARRNRIAFE